jgi:hypothetical protein
MRRKIKAPKAAANSDRGEGKAKVNTEEPSNSTSDSKPANENAGKPGGLFAYKPPSPLELQDRMVQQALAKELGREKAPDEPVLTEEEKAKLRLLFSRRGNLTQQ